MEKPLEKRRKSKAAKNSISSSTKHDSAYGSLVTGNSSSSSLSLSLFSESDLAEAPSTSGCSSEMASALQSKERKKEKAKEFMKKLKSMLPKKEKSGKLDTLSTLAQLVDSMRQLNEGQKRDSEFKTPPPHSGSYLGSHADKLAQSQMFISVSQKNHVIQMASPSLMEHLGYPSDWWRGRLLKDFLYKKDVNTVNSCIALHTTDEEKPDSSDVTTSSSSNTETKEFSKYFYARFRRFRKLGDGFSLQNIISYCPFMIMIGTRTEQRDSDDESSRSRKYITLYCQPLRSGYGERGQLPKEKKFSLRHSIFCNYSYVHPNAVHLLGFLPQDFNGQSIFDLYHPDDFQKLLEIHKKIVASMGQPFKSGGMRLKTRNGCYVEVETEWSSFMNPWSMKLEFIIGQHTVIKGPSRPNLYEDVSVKMDKDKSILSLEMKRIQDKILDVLKKPIESVFAEPTSTSQLSIEHPVQSKSPSALSLVREAESSTPKPVTGEKQKTEAPASGPAENKSAVLDDKGISSIYNQLNYSHNIKRFLMSHPKSFSNVSDEDSMVVRDDSEDDATNDEEELPLEIPVVKPPSCGSSTQVHVSEQGHGEEMFSPPTFGDEVMPPRENADNIHSLTEETLKKHTKMQERLYLQRISEEQPLLLNMRKVKVRGQCIVPFVLNQFSQTLSGRLQPHQKRPRPRESTEDENVAKHPCTNSGVFRSSTNIFTQNFPTVTSADLPTTTPAPTPMYRQADGQPPPFDKNFINNQGTQLGIFPTGYQTGTPPLAFPIPAHPIHLVPGDPSLHLSMIPTTLAPIIPTNPGFVGIAGTSLPQNMWPYYPQTGYTLLPQVMEGFYRPVLQPVQVQAIPAQPTAFNQNTSSTQKHPGQPKGGKGHKNTQKTTDSDNPTSSVEDTTSSILYLLEADSSTFEDSDNKGSNPSHPGMVQRRNKRSTEPPWLRGIKWNTETKMKYQLPCRKMNSVLKSDQKILKKNQSNNMVQTHLIQLLEDISLPAYQQPVDEEADYIFFPDVDHKKIDEADKTQDILEELNFTPEWDPTLDSGGGDDDGGGGENVVWTLGGAEEEENYDTPVNSHSEDEKAPPTPTVKDDNDRKCEEPGQSSQPEGENKATEDTRAIISMDAMFMSEDQSASTTSLSKRNESPKDGSLSDEGSASETQKNEMEEVQSTCSKVSSDMTPSDDRSNEEAGSSLKESDASLKPSKGVSSVASSNSSSDPLCSENSAEGLSGSPPQISEDFFKKLFVPLKVRVSERLDTPGMPHWLLEAHLSKRVAMTYKVPSRQLEDVLSEDKKKMFDMSQSSTVKQQLLQLLNEVDIKSDSANLASLHRSSYQKAVPITTKTVSSHRSDSTNGGDSAFCKTSFESGSHSERETDSKSIVFTVPQVSRNLESVIKPELVHSSSNMSIETPSLGELGHSSSNVSMESLASEPIKTPTTTGDKDSKTANKTTDMSVSDSNSDPVAEEPRTHSSGMSQTSTSTKEGFAEASATNSSIQESFHAMQMNMGGQQLEDVIMKKVFFPSEASDCVEMKNIPNLYNGM